MRFLLAALALLLIPAPAFAQRQPDLAAQRAAMERLAPLAGHWRGTVISTVPVAMTAHHDERVVAEIDGLVVTLRGTAYSTDAYSGTPVFQAIGFITYDDARQRYEVHSYAMGHAGTSYGEMLPTGEFRWGFAPGGPVQIRYTIRFDATTWYETGEISYDNGAAWQPMVTLDLRRVP